GLILVDRDPPKGLLKLRHACELDVRSVTPRLRLAETLFKQGKLDEAALKTEEILREQPGHAPALLVAARVSLAQDRLGQAEGQLIGASHSPLTGRAAYELLAQVLSRQARHAEATQALAEAEFYPDNKAIPDPYWEEANMRQTGKRFLSQKIQQLERRHDLAGAVELAELLTREYPLEAPSHYLLGSVRLKYAESLTDSKSRLRLVRLAQEDLRAAVKLSPQQAAYLLAVAYSVIDKSCPKGLKEAVAWAEQAVVAAPTDAHVYRSYAQLYENEGLPAEAVGVLLRGLKACPDDGTLHEQLGRLYWLDGSWITAYYHVSRIKRSANTHSDGLFYLCRAVTAW